MSEEQTIPVLVDQVEEVTVRAGMPPIQRSVTTVINISKETVANNFASFLASMFDVLEKSQKESTNFAVDTVNLSLAITSTGEISLGAVKGSATGQTSIAVTLRYKNSGVDKVEVTDH